MLWTADMDLEARDARRPDPTRLARLDRRLDGMRKARASEKMSSFLCLPLANGYRPSISMRFCTAAPEAPLPRLSNFATSKAWRRASFG